MNQCGNVFCLQILSIQYIILIIDDIGLKILSIAIIDSMNIVLKLDELFDTSLKQSLFDVLSPIIDHIWCPFSNQKITHVHRIIFILCIWNILIFWNVFQYFHNHFPTFTQLSLIFLSILRFYRINEQMKKWATNKHAYIFWIKKEKWNKLVNEYFILLMLQPKFFEPIKVHKRIYLTFCVYM